jgi:hypothetical protein
VKKMVKKKIVSLAVAGALGSLGCGAALLVSAPAYAVTCPPTPSDSSGGTDPYGYYYYDTTPNDADGVYVGESQQGIPVAGSGFVEVGYNSTTGAYVETAGSNQFVSGFGGVGTNGYFCHP